MSSHKKTEEFLVEFWNTIFEEGESHVYTYTTYYNYVVIWLEATADGKVGDPNYITCDVY